MLDIKTKLEECNACEGTGIVFYTKRFDGLPYLYGARCHCKNAKQWNTKIPLISQVNLDVNEFNEGGERKWQEKL